jgi:hypothetical protein
MISAYFFVQDLVSFLEGCGKNRRGGPIVALGAMARQAQDRGLMTDDVGQSTSRLPQTPPLVRRDPIIRWKSIIAES